MQVSYSSLFVCFDLYPRHIAPALMLQRTPPQADQDRKDEPVFGAGITVPTAVQNCISQPPKA